MILEVAPDTDQGYKIMTNEDMLREAMNLFHEWSHTYSNELVTMSSRSHTIDVIVFHECTEDVAEQIADEANQKVLGQFAAYVHKLTAGYKCTISIVWMKED